MTLSRYGLVLCLVLMMSQGCAATRFALWYDPPVVTETAHLKESQELELEGDDLFAKRQKTQALQVALMKWEVAAGLSASPVLYTKLARGHYLYGVESSSPHNFTVGLGFAEKALSTLAPEFARKINSGMPFLMALTHVPQTAVPALYWYALNLEKWALHQGFFTRMRYEKWVNAAMARVNELDDKTNSYGRLSDSEDGNKR